MRVMFLTTLSFIVLIATGWISDFITFKEESTIYTADCANGNWQAGQCTGMLIAGKRYRFRALKAHREVLFWVAGSNEPSAKFGDCEILNGRNWSCKANADLKYTITRGMVDGSPVPRYIRCCPPISSNYEMGMVVLALVQINDHVAKYVDIGPTHCAKAATRLWMRACYSE